MKFQLYGLNVRTSPALQSHAQHRFQSVLSRIDEKIGSVIVRFSDLNGPRGGQDKQCSVRVQVLGGNTIAVREADQDLYRAIDRAAGRVSRIAREKLRRIRAKKRRGPRVQFDVSHTPPQGITGA